MQPRRPVHRGRGGGTVLTSQGHDLMHWNELTLPNKIAPVDKRPR